MPKESEQAMDKMFALAQRAVLGEAGINFFYCLEEGKYYIFSKGVWETVFDIELLSAIADAMPQVNKFTLAMRKQMLENTQQINRLRLKDLNIMDMLNFKEGMFSAKEEKIYNHALEYYSTIRIPYPYNYNTECPLWEKTLLEIFDGDNLKAEVLQEFFGYCLTRDTSREKALLLLGASRTGKSTILHILRNMIGKANVSSVPLKFISNPQYTPMLINKLVNIDSDVSGKAEAFEAEFKIITSGEPVSCNQKFIPTFEFNPYCKMVMAANEFPRITDHSSAFYKRLILIPCDRVFEDDEQNIRLKDDLIKELPGIFNWSVRGLLRLNERGKFIRHKFMEEAIQELREQSNPIDIFFKENIVVDLDGKFEIEKQDLYNRYLQWCKENGSGYIANNKFGMSVYAKYGKCTPKDVRNITGTKRVWRNLRYKLPPQEGQQVNFND